jgi:hypothetical protein
MQLVPGKQRVQMMGGRSCGNRVITRRQRDRWILHRNFRRIQPVGLLGNPRHISRKENAQILRTEGSALHRMNHMDDGTTDESFFLCRQDALQIMHHCDPPHALWQNQIQKQNEQAGRKNAHHHINLFSPSPDTAECEEREPSFQLQAPQRHRPGITNTGAATHNRHSRDPRVTAHWHPRRVQWMRADDGDPVALRDKRLRKMLIRLSRGNQFWVKEGGDDKNLLLPVNHTRVL